MKGVGSPKLLFENLDLITIHRAREVFLSKLGARDYPVSRALLIELLRALRARACARIENENNPCNKWKIG
jgi:hypothetical protein